MVDFSQQRRGFAALEFVVVIAILGVLFAMTLKGAVAIEMMRGVATVHELRNYQNVLQNYLAEFHQLPGDDPVAPRNWGRPATMTVVDGVGVSLAGDGIIQGPLSDPLNPDGEQLMAWRDLRLSGFLDGDQSLVGQAAQPEDYFGTIFGLAEENLGLQQVLCAMHVPGRVALFVDKQLDDGNISTGRVRATSRWDPVHAKNTFDTPDQTPYDPNKTYIICMPYQP